MMSQNPFRRHSQNSRLLERLRTGPVTNVEIAHQMHILRYSGRIHELRCHGYDVITNKVPDRKGVYYYQIVEG